MTQSTKTRLPLATQIMISLVAGLATGLVFGELVGFFSVVGDVVVQLLQMTILPYIVVSLISGLGQLDSAVAGRMAVKGGLALVTFWALALTVIFLAPLAFPVWEAGSFFSQSVLTPPESVDFLELYIPTNPFQSMARTLVPAVVVFSLALGVALIGMRGQAKDTLLETLEALRGALTRVTNAVVRFLPLGIFAICASTAGTMSLEEFGRLQVFFVTYSLVGLLLTLVVFPAVVTSTTPLTYREILGVTRGVLVTAFATGNLFIVLPVIVENCRELLDRHGLRSEDSDSVVDVTTTVVFNFPSGGKLLTLLFITFAGWYAGSPVKVASYPGLAVSGLASLFASVNMAVPFLLDMLRIPADLYELFLASSVLTSRFATLLGAMNLVVITLVTTTALCGGFALRWGRLLRNGAVAAALVVLSLLGARMTLAATVQVSRDGARVLAEMTPVFTPVDAVVHAARGELEADAPEAGRSRVERIRERGRLVVGYRHDAIPFSFIGEGGGLIGYDVEMAHLLARELEVELHFVPFTMGTLTEQLDAGEFDVAMAFVAGTTPRFTEMEMSAAYLDATLAFVVKDHVREDFTSRESIATLTDLRVFVTAADYFVPWLHARAPGLEVVPLESNVHFFEVAHRDHDALLTTAETGAVWTLRHPEFSVVVPEDVRIRQPIAYPVARGEVELAAFLTRWVELKGDEGTLDRLHENWILGRGAVHREPRWSVLRDVLGWVD